MPHPPRHPTHFPITTYRAQSLLLLAWAALFILILPTPNLWPLAYFTLIPLTLTAALAPQRRRILLLASLFAWLWGLAAIQWIIPVTLPGYFAFAAYLALYPILFVILIRLFARRFNLPFMLTVPLAWVTTEYLRGLAINGFPWFLLAHSQPTILIQTADLFGTYFISFTIALTNGALCDLILLHLAKRKNPSAPSSKKRFATLIAIPLTLLIFSLAYGYFRIQQTDTSTDSLRIAVIQTNIPQSNKDFPEPGEEAAAFKRMIELSTQAMQSDPPPHVIVWPETSLPYAINDEALTAFHAENARVQSFFTQRKLTPEERAEFNFKYDFPHDRYRTQLADFARKHKVTLIVGAHAKFDHYFKTSDKYIYFNASFKSKTNAAYQIDPSGKIRARYDKIHRVPFGEYIPGVESIPWLKKQFLKLTPYGSDYTLTPGKQVVHFQTTANNQTFRLAAPICFEDVVSYIPRKMIWRDGKRAADILLNLSNDGWFAGSAEGPQHEQLARFRCVENRTPMARSVNTGVSSFIDSAGRVLQRVQKDGKTQSIDGFAVRNLHKDPRKTLFASIGDLFALITLIVTSALLLTLFIRRFRCSGPLPTDE